MTKPFTRNPQEPGVQLDGRRVLEALFTAAASSALSVVLAVPVLRQELDGVKQKVGELAVDSRQAQIASASDRGDIIRLQSQMMNTQERLADLARTSNERLTIVERGLMRITDKR